MLVFKLSVQGIFFKIFLICPSPMTYGTILMHYFFGIYRRHMRTEDHAAILDNYVCFLTVFSWPKPRFPRAARMTLLQTTFLPYRQMCGAWFMTSSLNHRTLPLKNVCIGEWYISKVYSLCGNFRFNIVFNSASLHKNLILISLKKPV